MIEAKTIEIRDLSDGWSLTVGELFGQFRLYLEKRDDGKFQHMYASPRFTTLEGAMQYLPIAREEANKGYAEGSTVTEDPRILNYTG